MLILILTYKCNYACIMCRKSSLDDNEYKRPGEMDYKKLEETLRKYRKDLCLVQLFGGEPIHYKQFLKTIKLLQELKIPYCICTNGYLLSQEISHELLKGCLWVSFSLDAADPNLYKKIRVGGNLQTVSSNIMFLNQLKERKKQHTPILNANTTVFSYNIHDVPNLLYFCKRHGISSLSVGGGRLYNSPKVKEEHLIKNNKDKAVHYIAKAKETAKSLGIVLRVRLRSIQNTTPKPLETKPKHQTSFLRKFGLYFETTLQPDFNVVAASENYKTMGNMSTESLESIWNGAKGKYSNIRSRIPVQEENTKHLYYKQR
ncbi:radical SAM protein [Cytophagaceae bacterium ABcell3]|nr:radical SAM protein [Cytophagaceae bacterium ABcell3]